jgi:hypothetical protein
MDQCEHNQRWDAYTKVEQVTEHVLEAWSSYIIIL